MNSKANEPEATQEPNQVLEPELPNYLKDLQLKRAKAMKKAIQISKTFRIIKKVFHATEGKYKDIIAEYKKADEEYAHTLFDWKQRTMPKLSKKPAYNAEKRSMEKALKALKNLSPEQIESITQQAKEGLF